MPRAEVPRWTPEAWLRIQFAKWEGEGWIANNERCGLYVEGPYFDVEPVPDPDPPNRALMSSEDFNRIKGGELLAERNVILKRGICYMTFVVPLDKGMYRAYTVPV
jgi:hypothetical protein